MPRLLRADGAVRGTAPCPGLLASATTAGVKEGACVFCISRSPCSDPREGRWHLKTNIPSPCKCSSGLLSPECSHGPLPCTGPSTSTHPWIWLQPLSQSQQACVKVAWLSLPSMLEQSPVSHSPQPVPCNMDMRQPFSMRRSGVLIPCI